MIAGHGDVILLEMIIGQSWAVANLKQLQEMLRKVFDNRPSVFVWN